MKKIITVVCVLSIISCGKKVNTPQTTTQPNTVTVSTGGKTYTVTGNHRHNGLNPNINEVEVSTTRQNGNAHILIRVYKGENTPTNTDFEMHLESELGNGTGIGVYPLKHYNEYYEKFAGGSVCAGTFTGNITVTQNDSTVTKGTFEMTLNHCSDSATKKVTGTFNATNPSLF